MNREELLKNAKPILFNTEMVQAITEGRKTVTRRVVKLKNGYSLEGKGKEITENINLFGDDIIFRNGEETNETLKPQYKVGDILYVRETFKRKMDGYSGIDFGGYLYKADYKTVFKDNYNPWKPSIHMPKEAARIFLKVTDVKVEKLQNMTQEDCIKEGCGGLSEEQFAEFWDSLNAKRGYGWKVNPWVWVVEFERVEE